MHRWLALALSLAACQPTAPASPTPAAPAASSASPAASAASHQPSGFTPMPSSPAPRARQHNLPTEAEKLKVEDLRVGEGDVVEPGSHVVLHYVGTLPDGKVFDSSVQRNQPFEVGLGRGLIIKGMEQGLMGMRVGGRRRLTIPPELGYGAQGRPPTIPPATDLIFDIELLEVR